MKIRYFSLCSLSLLIKCLPLFSQQGAGTFCNPLNLNYRFSTDHKSYREAADPVVHLYKNKYYLYASKSGGYWYADDLLHWHFRPAATLPVEDYAPAVETINDTAFFIASSGKPKIYYNNDPLLDNWKVYNPDFPVGMTDPAIFKDEDGRVYFYYGCSATNPIMGVELNPRKRLDTIGAPVVLIQHEYKTHGWEEHGARNNNGKSGWNEGSWMTKHDGKYYLQYAAPGTEFDVYGDGVYVADHPLGPFTYMVNSPFSYKPGGFINGAGHGNTFMDKYGNYWHSATMAISVRHMFERRIGVFPAFFDADGDLHCITSFGDYPMQLAHRKMDFSKQSLFTGWMLLSYHKPVIASSALPSHEAALAADENVRTWWSAATGDKEEWLQMDLQKRSLVRAIQVNFADEGARLRAGDAVKPYRYVIEASVDSVHWTLIIDKSLNTADVTHDYMALDKPVSTRFLRI